MWGSSNFRSVSLALVLTLLCVFGPAATADAATASGAADGPVHGVGIDPLLRPELQPLPELPGLPAPDAGGLLPALLTTDRLQPREIEELEARGLSFRRDLQGRLIHVGRVHPVDAELAVLQALAGQGLALRLARTLDAASPMTAVTAPAAGLDSLVASGASPVDGPTGLGMGVLDLDSSIDLFHPHFFRADGGITFWLDADEDGLLTPGIDGVDVDRDGVLTDDEILRIAQHRRVWSDPATGAARDEGLDDGFDPGRDWLWLDEDGDGLRDYGPEAGFDDRIKGFGERMYVPDDVDGNGRIETPERLLRLGSSRVAAVLTPDHTYLRDEDLTEYAFRPFYRQDHGTGVGGALVGGQLYPQPRPRGLLPEADLFLFDRTGADQADQVEALYLAQELGVDVVLWEYGQWVFTHLDGSTPVEAAIDALSTEGMVQICPAGNLSDSGKHGSTTSTGGELTFHVRVDSWVASSLDSLYLDIHTMGAPVELACRLISPGGEEVDLDWGGAGPDIAGVETWSASWESSRGSTLWSTWLDGAIEAGTWRIGCQDAAGGSRDFHAYLADGWSWSRGAWFLQDDPTSTLCLPSTADSCVTVAAWGAASDYWDGEGRGERHLYSSVGPRIDGGKTVDVAAPADPFVPAPLSEVSEDAPNDPPYGLFSGTSGAGPHVAAAAVLLRELDPDADGEELRQSLRDGARVDSFVAADADTFPDDAWGYGKLSAHTSAYGESPATPPAAPVQVDVELVASWDTDERCAVTGVATVAGQPNARVRWDLDYDGEWDTGFLPEPVEFELAPDEVRVLRAQAAADGWWVGGQAVIFHAPDPCPKRGCTGCRAGPTGGDAVGLMLVVALLAIRRRRLH